MYTRKEIEFIEKEAKKYFLKSGSCHDWSHVERVRKLALKLAKKEKARMDLVEISAILHDVGREEEMKANGTICHAEKSAQIGMRILKQIGAKLEDQEKIFHAVISHRFRNNHEPKSIEAKCLYDADKLDSIGAIGIARDFQFAGEVGAKLYNENKNFIAENAEYTAEDTGWREYVVKLSKIKDKMLTREGKKMARERHVFMTKYFKRFWEEIEGKK